MPLLMVPNYNYKCIIYTKILFYMCSHHKTIRMAPVLCITHWYVPENNKCRIKLSYRILNEWYLTVLPSFSIK
jgi:hypothetical protein